MKRRNVEVGKMRRPIKRNKISEGFYGSTLLYMKFLILWALVILADFILEFRFEFLWPFYLLLRSVYDSFKYQGLAFSVFFVCVALTSDMLCFFFIPVHWLFFAASTYVWVQYVWHTDKGICPPTVVLWVLFVYLEAAVRLRDIKHMPGHLDLCRPFAAHCIGYPVVTLGFGFKSYIGFRMRQRRQRDVGKENEFYLQLMQQALPVEANTTSRPVQECGATPPITNNHIPNVKTTKHVLEKNGHLPNGISNNIHSTHNQKTQRKSLEKAKDGEHEHSRHPEKQKFGNGVALGVGLEDIAPSEIDHKPLNRKKEKKEQDKEREAAEYLQRLELDAKRLRLDLHNSRASEQELRLQVASLTTSEKVSKGELLAMQRELEDLQSKLQSCNSLKSQDKQTINNLERRIAEERRARTNTEAQLSQERKNRKQDEVRAAQVAAQSIRGECTESCKQRRRELDTEISNLRSSQKWTEDEMAALERENSALHEQLRDKELLVSTLNALQEKNQHLENSLSAETRIKLDLFSALGEAKRQLEIKDSCLRSKEKEIEELKSKIAQVLAVMPNDTFGGPTPSSAMSRVRLAESPPGSTLDPNATAYTPKSSLIASTEA